MSEPATAHPPRVGRIALPVLLVLGVGTLAAAIWLPAPKRKPVDAPAPSLPLVPAFALTERSGKTVTDADLRGKVWVASFVFTRCTGPCPSVTATMARLQTELDLANTPDLRLVTFTVDPDRDSPDELKKYADHSRAHSDRWLFLTGPEGDISRLLHDGFKIAAKRSALDNPPAGQEFDHSTRLVVVDRAGHVRGYFDGYRGTHDADGEQFNASLAALKEAVRAELAAGR